MAEKDETGVVLQTTDSSAVSINQVDKASESLQDYPDNLQKTPIWGRLPALMVFMFVGGTMVAMPIAVAQVVLIAVGNNAYQSLGFVLFNFFTINWCVLMVGFTACWASSLLVLRISYVLFPIFAGLEAVWAWYYLGSVSGIIIAVIGFFVLFGLPKTATFFKLVSSQPYNASFATWLSMFRLWAIVAAPIVATYIRTGSATAISYFTVLFFTLTAMVFCQNIRADFTINSDCKTLDSLLYKIHWYRFVCRYVPVIGMMLVFSCFFLVTTSGLDRTDQDLNVFNITCGTLFFFCFLWYYLLGPFVDYSPPESWIHRRFSSLTRRQYEILLKGSSSD